MMYSTHINEHIELCELIQLFRLCGLEQFEKVVMSLFLYMHVAAFSYICAHVVFAFQLFIEGAPFL